MAPTSNILSVFSPHESRDIPDSENCLPCQIMSAAVLTMGGLYCASGAVLNPKANDIKSNVKVDTSPAWRSTVRLGGVALIGAGIWRAGDGFLWNKREDKELE
ncbi:hypothetical protein NADFUDRAFT_39167 [Nadsonia fulvescens var. elongata DSM 6958]|uniref:DUF4536 domain-containing protein n=1 Tax=Nadsonia fulvescens var. elongata DSM 6958 TaxID=857566 RepID=A0A1E3PQN5_9ASCO|nr:hypothetical protein NADFUDRAFT_39167 [Nadsonia fulvescens var. elongata DSM 6958]